MQRALILAIGLMMAAPLPAPAQSSPLPRMFEHSHPHRLPFSSLICRTDYQLRRQLAGDGFSNIYLNAANGPRREARVSRGAWVYLVMMNSCTGAILSMERLRHR